MKPLLTGIVLFFTLLTLNAQKLSGGIFIGGANYQGDLVEVEMLPSETNPAVGMLFRYSLTSKLALKASFYGGHISGSDANSSSESLKSRGYSFRSSIFEGSMAIEWDLLGKKRFDRKGGFNKSFSPYVFVGMGMIQFKPTVLGLPENSPDAKADYKKLNFIIPFGGGIKYDLTDRITTSFEVATHLPFTDYLDGISYQGFPNRDWYAWGGITIAYWFGSPKIATKGGPTKTGAKYF
jgi:OmpA-OmpF porin, OOP family